jgi:hypothetical protein
VLYVFFAVLVLVGEIDCFQSVIVWLFWNFERVEGAFDAEVLNQFAQ